MGEIADAIRRARGAAPIAQTTRATLSNAPSLREIQPPAPPGPRATGTAHGHPIDSVHPRNEALVIEQDGANAEACRHLALRLRETMEARRARSVAIVSAERADGKSTVACNLAVALASLTRTREVALVDFDLRKPSIGAYLDLRPYSGIEDALEGRASLEDVAINVQIPAIDVFPVATPRRSAHEIFVQERAAQVIAELERRYQVVIIDTPPAPIVPDANLILRHVPVCVPVVRTGKTRARSLRRLLDTLPNDRIAGWIVNCQRTPKADYGEYYYGESEMAPQPGGSR